MAFERFVFRMAMAFRERILLNRASEDREAAE